VWQYLGKLHSLNRFSYGTDLIDFQQQGSAGLLPYCALDASWIGTQKVITNHLHAMMLSPSATQSQQRLQSILIIQTAYAGDTLPYLRRLHCLITLFSMQTTSPLTWQSTDEVSLVKSLKLSSSNGSSSSIIGYSSKSFLYNSASASLQG